MAPLPSSENYALGTPEQQTFTYNWQSGTNLLQSILDPLGRTTTFTYDSMGNVTSVTRLAGTPNATTTSLSYEPYFARVTSVTDALGHMTAYAYDHNGNLASVTDALGHATTFTNNSSGLITQACDALNNCATFMYSAGELVGSTDPIGRTTMAFTDEAGRVVSLTNAMGQSSNVTYDSLDRVIAITDALGGQTSLTYDANGNLLTVQDANNHTTQLTYDNRDRVVSRIDALGQTELYQYDELGNLTQLTDRRGRVSTYSYDPANRPSFAGFGLQPGPAYESSVAFTYDLANRLTQVVDSASGTTSLLFDGLDRLTSESSPAGTVGYTYDAASRRSTMQAPSQPLVSYTYDSGNRLTQIAQGAAIVQIGYDRANRRTSLVLPNGVQATYSYNAAWELTGLSYSHGSTSLGNLTYVHDLNGNVTSIGGALAFTNLPTATSVSAHDAANRLTTWGSALLSYDQNGNLSSDGTHAYGWDARNRLTTIDSGSTATFAYDWFGRRTSKTAGGISTTFLYDGVNAIQESTNAGNAYSLVGGMDDVLQRTDSAGSRGIIKDALGSTLALADSTGTIQSTYTYEPVGGTTAAGMASTNDVVFAGRELDTTGLYYYRARYYNPKVGRFISEDPIGFAGGGDTNLYAYVTSNPVNAFDPDGLGTVRIDPNSAMGQRMNNMTPLEKILFPLDFVMPLSVVGEGAAAAAKACSLAEKLTLEEAMGGAGTRIMEGKIRDPRYPENLWAKMQHVHVHPEVTDPYGNVLQEMQTTVIHYWENLLTEFREGFKFK
jgi:RHS repeat-associated protein